MKALPHRTEHLALVVLFLIVIASPGLGLALGIDQVTVSDTELRELAPIPAWSWTPKAVGEWPDAFQRYFEDHFAFRNRLIGWRSSFLWNVLMTSPSDSVVAGEHGWFFYADDGGLEDFTNETLLSADEVTNWRATIERARDWCRSYGMAYVFTIAPDKHVIYPEEFPPTIHQLTPTSRMEQVLNAVADLGVAVDVRPALLHAKGGDRLYHLTDTHWNDRGAFVAYRQIIDAVRTQVPRVPAAWPRSDFVAEPHVVDGMDLARMMGLSHVLRETDLRLVPQRARQAVVIEPAGAAANAEEGRLVTEIPNSSLPRAVIFRDSFTSALAPFLSEHFSRAVYLWQNDFDDEAVRTERADVVIQQIVGRHLYGFIPTPDLIPAAQ